MNNNPIVTVWGTGTPKREFLYSEDMVDACVHLMNLPDEQYNTLLGSGAKLLLASASTINSLSRELGRAGEGEATPDFMPPLINIGVGHNLSIKELAEAIRSIVGYTGEITIDATKSVGTPRKHNACLAAAKYGLITGYCIQTWSAISLCGLLSTTG